MFFQRPCASSGLTPSRETAIQSFYENLTQKILVSGDNYRENAEEGKSDEKVSQH